jgi:peptidoglycan/xylan/chitin deacetylase (PgdA/CDA1 family)
MNFKRTSVIFLMLILFLNVFNTIFGISGWWYMVPGFFLIGMVGLGSSRIGMSFYFEVICRFKSNDKIVLTFDDGPNEMVTPKVLEVLKKHRVKATFFCIGSKAEKYPHLIKQAYDVGHIIANHSNCHKNMYGFYSSEKLFYDIVVCNVILKNIIKVTPNFFRPPFGVTNPNMKRALKRYPMITIGWSLRTLDTMNNDSAKLMERLKKTRPGDIVLFHDRVENIDLVLDEYLLFCEQQHWQIAPLDEMIKLPAYD